MDRLYLADEHDAHVDPCYVDAERDARCWWCRGELVKHDLALGRL